jgi:methenyltetrahydrofolate cyclohydrolase
MARLAELSVSAFLDALASAQPTPGGGTAAALSGAMGVSLLMMVSGLEKTRTNTDAERAALGAVRAQLSSLRDRLTSLADEDSDAFDAVMAAYRLPKGSDAEKASRTRAIQDALRAATESPLDTLRTTVDSAVLARRVAEHGNPAAASDVRVALELLECAGAGAVANVEININGLADESYRKSAASAILELTNRLTEETSKSRLALG